MEFKLKEIGRIKTGEGKFQIIVDEKYREALNKVDDFSELVIMWWADKVDDEDMREVVDAGKPYVKGPENMGIFATRSPLRPNPICISVISVAGIDKEKGVIETYYIDAEDNTPLIDIKPYNPATDRMENPPYPKWCEHWPKSIEESGEFDWENEFLF